MTDELRTDQSPDDLDEFERLGRQAGLELRAPAPSGGPHDVQSTATRRRITTTIASVGAVLVVLVAGVVLLSGGSDPPPAATTTTTVTLAPAEAVELVGHTGIVTALDATSTSGLIATGADDSTVRVWDAASGAELQRIDVDIDEGSPIAVVLSPDGTAVAAHLSDGTTFYWLVEDGSITSPFAVPWDDPDYFEPSATFTSPDGSFRVETGSFGGATLVDVSSREVVASLPGQGRSYSAAWNEDGSLVAVKFDGRVKIWRLDSLDETQIIGTPAYEATADRLQFMADGRIAFTVEDVVYIEPVDPIAPLEE